MLSENDRKAELSYAYLHAVAAASGFSCSLTDRHLDGRAIDALVGIAEKLDEAALLTEFLIPVQLKASSVDHFLPSSGRYSLSLDVQQYDKLRSTLVSIPKIVVLLSLPSDTASWLQVSADSLIARHCARWTTLYGQDSVETESTTIYFEDSNVLTPTALREIARKVSLGREIL